MMYKEKPAGAFNQNCVYQDTGSLKTHSHSNPGYNISHTLWQEYSGVFVPILSESP